MKQNGYLRLFGQHFSLQMSRVVWLFLLLCTGISIEVSMPQILRYYVDTAALPQSSRLLLGAACFYIVLVIIKQIIQLSDTYIGERVAWLATNTIRQAVALHCLTMDMSFHKEFSPGEMIERIDGDVTALANFFSRFALKILGNVLLIVGVIVVLLVTNLWLGLCFSVFTVISFWLIQRIQAFATPHWIKARQAKADLLGFLGDRLAGTEDIRANGAAPSVMNRFTRVTVELLHTERGAYVRGRALWPVTIAIFSLGYALVFLLGVQLLHLKLITLGTILALVSYVDLLLSPLEEISEEMQDFQSASACLKRIHELLARESSVRDPAQDAKTLPAAALSVQFCNVDFAYSDGRPILHSVSFDLQPGQTLGLLGRTGSGKTTMIRLLLRLYDVTQGSICLNGTDIRQLSLRELRKHVAIVPQDVTLFHASVRDNITLFEPAVSDDRILAILEQLGLGQWYRSLPAGLDTSLEPGKTGASAGQEQLIALARIFIKDPGLVILDEAMSRLDSATEEGVQQAIQQLLQGRTAMIIAHRLQTVQGVDAILLLEDGKVVEFGPRAGLAQNPASRYAQVALTGKDEVFA